MVERVIATASALALIEQLKAEYGPDLMFHQSGGCCDNCAANCYLPTDLTIGPHDVHLGDIGGVPFYISESQYQYWKNSQLIIGVTEGSGATFSLEGPEGVCFTTTSRLWTDSELEALNHPDLDPSPGKALQ